jgi:hypothetical protein
MYRHTTDLMARVTLGRRLAAESDEHREDPNDNQWRPHIYNHHSDECGVDVS